MAEWNEDACAHSHPLVCRVRCLLKSPDTEIHPMRKLALLAVAGTLFLAGAVRVELVAKAAEATKESTLEKRPVPSASPCGARPWNPRWRWAPTGSS
jgi:hypothetical protein